MSRVLLILSTLFITATVLAQVPERMSYQAVIRNGKNVLVANQPIGLRISIINGTVNGTIVYQEVFHPNPVTNANGLVTAEIGSGTPTLGAFSSIDWANGPFFIKAETDTTGGTNYTIAGTTRLLSVPYALHAKTAESFSGAITETDPAFAAWKKDYNDLINTPDLSNYATKDMINQTNTSNDYNELINKPDLSIYATKNMANQNITNLADPVNPQDAATKAYVDALLKRIEALEKLETDRILRAGGFYDDRDSIFYKVVKIGNQVWMAENLKYLPEIKNMTTMFKYPEVNTEPFYVVNNIYEYSFDTQIYNTYGVLYNWPAAMNGASSSNSNPSGVQGVCPSGWHLPSYSEWEQLIDYLGGDSIAGGKLKEAGIVHWESPNTSATNESGFTALPGGDLVTPAYWLLSSIGFSGMWWSSSWNSSSPTDFFPSLEHNSNMVHWGKHKNCCNLLDYKGFGLSVRCVKD